MSDSMFDDDNVDTLKGADQFTSEDEKSPDKPEDKGRRRGNNENPSADLVRVYLNGIGKTALLTAEDEVELSKRIEVGLYATHLLNSGETLTRALQKHSSIDESRFLVYAAVFLEVTVISSEVSITIPGCAPGRAGLGSATRAG